MGEASQFSIVPRYVWQGCQPTEIKVYCALASYADWETGLCWPAQQTLAEAAAVSLSTVKRALHTLVAIGAVEVSSRDHNTGKAASNVYQLPFAINRPSTKVRSTHDLNREVVRSTHDPSVRSTHDPQTRVIEQQGLTTSKLDPNTCGHRPVDDTGYCTACDTEMANAS